MKFLQPTSWADALRMKAEHPEALPIAGGTDVMVELNFDRRRPEALLDLTKVRALEEWSSINGSIRIGAGVTYTRLLAELGRQLPGLAIASRTVGSLQIRNRGTVAGNLGTASPAGDALPPLLAAGADVEVESLPGGVRRIPIVEFLTGPKRNTLRADELIRACWVVQAGGPQQFAKIGTRNAMVIAVCSFALDVDVARRRVGTGIGSAGPTPLRAVEAERFLEGTLEDGNLWERRAPLPGSAITRFGELVAAAARPMDDVRGTADYRRRALNVMARRTLVWAWSERERG